MLHTGRRRPPVRGAPSGFLYTSTPVPASHPCTSLPPRPIQDFNALPTLTVQARDFCEWLGSPKAPALGGLPFGVLALGDKAYVHFCRCGRSLDERLEALGGSRLSPCVEVDREDWPVVDAWITEALSKLSALQLQPQLPKAGTAAEAEAPAAAMPPSKSRPFTAKLVAKEGLCTLSGGLPRHAHLWTDPRASHHSERPPDLVSPPTCLARRRVFSWRPLRRGEPTFCLPVSASAVLV